MVIYLEHKLFLRLKHGWHFPSFGLFLDIILLFFKMCPPSMFPRVFIPSVGNSWFFREMIRYCLVDG